MPEVIAEQGSSEWLRARLGKPTASMFKDVLPGARGKYLKGRQTYMYDLIGQMLTGELKEQLSTKAIDHGHENEPHAIAEYQLITGNTVRSGGLYLMDKNESIGASPDGLIDDDGGCEVKCFDTKRQIEICLNGMPAEVMAQIQGNMLVHDRQWWDFIAFDPRINGKSRIYIQRIERDNEYCDNLYKELCLFISEMNEKMQELA